MHCREMAYDIENDIINKCQLKYAKLKLKFIGSICQLKLLDEYVSNQSTVSEARRAMECDIYPVKAKWLRCHHYVLNLKYIQRPLKIKT